MNRMEFQDGEEMRRNRLRRRAMAMVSALHQELRDQGAADQVKRYMDFAEQSESDAKHLVNHYHKIAMDALNMQGPAPFKVDNSGGIGASDKENDREEIHFERATPVKWIWEGGIFRTAYDPLRVVPLDSELMPGEPTSHFIARKEKETCP